MITHLYVLQLISMDALALDALATESLGIDVCDVLMEQMHLRPLNTLKERHPAKFAAEISFLNQSITLKQNPGKLFCIPQNHARHLSSF